MRLAIVARSASGGHVLRKAEKGQWSPCSGLQSARPPLSCLGWGVTPTEDLNKLLVTSELSIFICKMEITLVPTLVPRLLTVYKDRLSQQESPILLLRRFVSASPARSSRVDDKNKNSLLKVVSHGAVVHGPTRSSSTPWPPSGREGDWGVISGIELSD